MVAFITGTKLLESGQAALEVLICYQTLGNGYGIKSQLHQFCSHMT